MIGPILTEKGIIWLMGTDSRLRSWIHMWMTQPRYWRIPVCLVAFGMVGSPVAIAQSVQKSEMTFPMSQSESRATMKLLSKKDGLSQTNVFDLLQDKNGFIWTSSGEGLNKYDGYSFTTYKHEPDNPHSLSDFSSDIIHEDSKGHIWTRMLDELDPITGYVVRHRADSSSSTYVKSGLATSFINDLEGNLWFATRSGVFKYDVETKTFDHVIVLDPDEKLTELFGERVKMLKGHTNTLWIGAFISNVEGHQLFKVDTGTSQSQRISLQSESDPGFSAGRINAWNWNNSQRSWYVDRNDHLWIGAWSLENGSSTIFQFNSDGNLVQSFPFADTRPHRLKGLLGQFGNFFETFDGVLWCVDVSNGFLRFNKESNSWTRYDFVKRSSEHSDFVLDPREDKTGHILFRIARGYENQQLFQTYSHERFDPKTGLVSVIKSGHEEKIVTSIDAHPDIFEDPSGQFWFSSDPDGMDRYNPETGELTHYGPTPNDANSFTMNRFGASLKDDSGGLWISQAEAGLFYIDAWLKSFTTILSQNRGEFNFNAVAIRGMFEARDGTVWIGSQSGLHKWNRNTSTFTNYVHQPVYRLQASGPISVTSIAEDDHGKLILGTTRGAFRFNPKTNGFSFISMFPEEEKIDNYVSIHVVKRKPDGTFGFATNNRGYLEMDVELNNVTFNGSDPKFRNTPFFINNLDFHVDTDGSIWLAPLSGLAQVDSDKNILSYYNREQGDPNSSLLNIVSNILPDPTDSNILWLATRGGGLVKWNKTSGTYVSFTEANSDIPNNKVYGVLPDDLGHLWLSTNDGLARFDIENESFDQFGVEDGLQDQEFNTNAFLKMSDGALVFGGIKGLNVFYPSEVTQNLTPPKIGMSKLVIYNPSADSSRSYNGVDPSMKEMTVLSHAENDLTFSFAALHFQNPEKNQYSYKLDGYEPTFSKPSTTHTVRYSNLPPGEYVFRIEASNSDGTWTENGYSFAFEILPPWWRTIWAYLAYSALFAGGLYQADRFQRRRLNRKQEEQARIDRAELEAEKASAQARVLLAENEVKELELKKAKELEYAFSALQQAHDDLKATQDQLIHSEKMASLGALTAGIAHEIKNPLNFINNFAEINAELADDLLEALPPSAQTEELRSILDSLRENSAVIGKHGKRADSIVRNMLQHASGKAGQVEATDFNKLVGEYVDLAFHGKRSQVDSFQSEIKRDFPPDVSLVPVVPQEFSRVVLNLVGNAFDAVQERALSESGPYAPLVEIRTSRNGDQVELRVIDNGTGIKSENMDDVFKPFFTTKPTGAGTGLGLSMSYDIVVKAHNGTMRVEPNERGGATFVVTLPGK